MGFIKQRVSITVTLEVDVEGWVTDYGTENKFMAVQKDVKAYAQSLVSEGNENWKVVSFK